MPIGAEPQQHGGTGPAGVRLDDVSLQDLTTKAKIRETALRLFAQQGISATSIRSVAAAAGVSPGLVVHHFASKRGLEQAVHEETVARMLRAVHGVGVGQALNDSLLSRRAAFEQVLQEQPHLANYLYRVLIEGDASSVDFFRRSLEIVRSEMDQLVDAGLARPMEDPDVGIALYWVLVNARFLLRPHLESVLGLDLSQPADVQRLQRAEIDLLTRPLFPPPT